MEHKSKHFGEHPDHTFTI